MQNLSQKYLKTKGLLNFQLGPKFWLIDCVFLRGPNCELLPSFQKSGRDIEKNQSFKSFYGWSNFINQLLN